VTDQRQPTDAAPFSMDVERQRDDVHHLDQMRGFVASTGLVSWIADSSGLIVDARQWCAFTGQTPDEHGRVQWLDAVHPDDRPSIAERWEAIRAVPRDFSTEFRLRRYDGEYREVVSKGRPLLAPGGEVDEWVGMVTDVTDFKQQANERESLLAIAQSARTQAESLSRWLQSLQRVTESAMTHLDLHALMRDLLGRVREAMAVDNAAILLLDEDKQDLVVYAARGPEEQVTGKARIPVGRGVAGTIAARREPLIIDDLSKVHVENPLLRETVHSLVGVPLVLHGRLLGVIHVDSARPRHFTEDDAHLLQVIADRVSLAIERAQLYEAERDARMQAEAVASQMRALQLVSDVALAHAGLRELLDALLASIREMMEVDNVAILLPDEQNKELLLYTVQGPEQEVVGRVHVPIHRGVAGRIAGTREPYIIKDLSQVPVENPFLQQHFRSLLGVPLLIDEELVGVLHVSTIRPRNFTTADRDILVAIAERIARAIARAREYEDIERQREHAEHRVVALEEATERMDVFLGIASHELRTPLTSLRTNIQMLHYWLAGQRNRRPEETEADYAVRMLHTAKPLVARSISAVARLDRLIQDLLDASRVNEQRLELQMEPGDLRDVVRDVMVEQREVHPGRALTLDLPDEPVPVLMDGVRVGQVLVNMVSNALKYSKHDRPVEVTLRVADGEARVSVRDYGAGIPASEHQRIWERFYRAPGIGHQSGSQVGLGLGLYISRDIVERHGGHVGLQSAPGEGSTFTFTLPLIAAS
jgi:PAS domain S-box-containing protein